MTENLPSSYGRFEVKSLLGRGAMGAVYLAEDPVIGREVAIKVVRVDQDLRGEDLEELRGRFQREFRSAGTLSHPNIVTVFDVGQDDGVSFIAMEFIRGESLEDVLRSDRLLNFKEVSDLAFQLGSALDYAHERGIVHRDIKPANILMTWDGQPKVTDFGVAKLSSSTMTRTGTIIGTPAYMSPEQITGHPVSGISDQFSLAVILYQLLTGERPFNAENPTTVLYKIVHEEPPRPQELNRKLPAEVDDVLLKALSKKPEDRYASCTDFAEALRECLGASAAADPTIAIATEEMTQITRPPERTEGSHRGIWIAGVLVTLFALGWFAWEAIGPKLSLGSGGSGAESGSGSPEAGKPFQGSVRVEGEPGLAIWVDGEDTGQVTPAQVALSGDEGEKRRLELRRGADVVATEGLTLGPKLPSTWSAGSSDAATAPPAGGDSEAAPSRQTFVVSSKPPGARITVDGKALDAPTPAEVVFEAGKSYQIGLELEGYKPTGATLGLETLAAAQRDSGEIFFPLEENIPPGFLRLAAPYPAAVTIAGRTYGPEQGLRVSLRPGSYQAQITAPDFYLKTLRQIEVVTDSEVALDLPELVSVTITAVPGNCRVSIDGQLVDFTPIRELPVAAGPHELTFEWPTLGKVETRLENISPDNRRLSARAPQ